METLKDIVPDLPNNNLQELYDKWWAIAKTGSLIDSSDAHSNLEKEESRVLRSLPDLNSLKITINNRYSDFDLIKYHFDYSPFKFSIAFRPKGVPVSFWCASLKNCVVSK